MIYKVADVVKEIGVSRQMIYKYLKKDVLKPYIVDVDGVIGITESGVNILKNIKCKEIEEEPECKIETSDYVKNLQQELTENFKKQIESYEDQLRMKDKQINELIKVTENSQILQKMILSNTEVKLLAYREELEVRRNEAIKENEKGIINKIKRFLDRGLKI